MAINKNFVVKNGLEVSTDLILADAITNKVGIGSTIPSTQLDVIGGIACTDFRAVGVATITTLKATTGIVTDLLATYGTVGIVTAAALQPTHVNVSGVLTAATAQFDGVTTIAVGVVTYLSGTNLNYSGIGTIQDSVITSLNVTGFSTIADLNVTGVATVATVDINAGDIEVTSVRTSNLNATGITTITSLSVTGSTFERLTVNNYSNLAGVTTIDNATGTNLNFSGVGTITTTEATSVQSTNLNVTGVTTTSTFEASTADIDSLTVNNYSNLAGVTTIDNATGTSLNFSGIGSVGGVLFSSGIITSTALGAGIVTFYGDGSQLQFLPSASPGGSDTQVQFNASGVFSGHPGFTYNYTTVGATSLNVSTGATIGTDLIVSRNVKITGVTTATTINASTVRVGSATTINSAGISVTGVVTATTYYGDGGNLSNVGASVSDNTSTDDVYYPIFTQNSSGSLSSVSVSTTKLRYNPSSGTLTVVDLNSTSDVNLKTNIRTIESAVEMIDNLRGVSFDWKETGKSSYGVIAQEIEEFLPQLVADGETKSVNYNGIIGILIEAVKHLNERVCELENS